MSVQQRIRFIAPRKSRPHEEAPHFGPDVRLAMLGLLDRTRKLILNTRLDWSVNRGNIAASETLGIRDLVSLLRDQVVFQRDQGQK